MRARSLLSRACAARPAPPTAPLRRAQERGALSELLLSGCAIVGGVVAFFGLLDGALHTSARALGAL